MKRIILAGLFALSTVAGAHADTSTYVWQGKGQWSDAQLQAAAQVCDQRYGVVENGAVTSGNYKRCMLKQGWRYQSTAREKTFINPQFGHELPSRGRHVGLRSAGGHREVFRPRPGIAVHAHRDRVGLLQFLSSGRPPASL